MTWLFKGVLAAAVVTAMPRQVRASDLPSAAEQTLERLRSVGIGEWRSMARKLECSSFDYTLRETDQKGKTIRQQTKRVSGRFAGKSFLFTELAVPSDQLSIYGRNDRYEFALIRNGNSPWKISWQSSRRDDDTPVGSACAYLGGMLQLPWSISATPLERLVNDSRFSIHQVHQSNPGDLLVSFSVSPTTVRPDSLQGLTGGTMSLDPVRHWALKRYSATYANKMSSSLKLEYAPSGPPELSHVDFELDVSPQTKSKFAIDVGKYEWAAAQSAEFTLPAFGLPDYREPFNTRRCVVLVNLGIVLMLLGLIVWRRRRETPDDSSAGYQ